MTTVGERPGEATARATATIPPPPAPTPPLALVLPPPPFRPVRLYPGAPWFFSPEQRLLLRSSALISSPDLGARPSPASTAPLCAAGDLGTPASQQGQLPTSPTCSRLVEPAAAAAPRLRSIIIAAPPAPTFLRRAAPAPAASIADALAPPCSASPASPRSPPGFPRPQFARSDLVATLFPQLAGISPGLRVRVAAPPSAACAAVPDAPVPSLKVRFAVFAARLEGTPPPPVHGAHRPCLKSASASTFKSPGRLAQRCALSSPASPAVDPSPFSPVVDNQEDGWRRVRPPYWWRKGRSSHLLSSRRSSPSFSSPRQGDFVKHKDRSCHRCLLKGHCKADCRNPFTCLRCRQIGHRARGCTNPPWSSSAPRSAALSVGKARPRDRQVPEPRRCDDNVRHQRDGDRDREGRVREARRGREGDRHSSSSKDRLSRSSSLASERRPDGGRQESLRDARGSRGDRGWRDDRRGVDVPASPYARKAAPFARKAAPVRVQGLSCGAASPASGRRDRPDVARDVRRKEDSREARSPPPSPRTTADDIIEILPMSPSMATSPRSASPPTPPRARPSSGDECRQETRDRRDDDDDDHRGCEPGCSISLPATETPRSTPRRAGCVRAITFAGSLDPLRSATPVHGDGSPARTSPVARSTETLLAPAGPSLFIPRQSPLLPSPDSPRPLPPTTRRKTLAGVTGFNLPRSSPRIKAKNRKAPIAVIAEKLLCKRMGIVEEGEMITDNAIQKFAGLFKGQLPDIAIAALRALFRLDCDLSTAVEEALLAHGGAAALDLEAHAGTGEEGASAATAAA